MTGDLKVCSLETRGAASRTVFSLANPGAGAGLVAFSVWQNQAARSRLSFLPDSSSRCGLHTLSSTKSAHLFAARGPAVAFIYIYIYIPFSGTRTAFSRKLFFFFLVFFLCATYLGSLFIPLHASSPRSHHGFGLDCGFGREHLRLVRYCRATQRLLEQHQPEVKSCPPLRFHVLIQVHLHLLAYHSPLC